VIYPHIRYSLISSYEAKNMVRAKLWDEDMQARFPEGTFKQIEAVLNEDESRTDFVREAVERELKRRAAIRKLRKR